MKRTITASKGRLSYGALRVALIIPNMVIDDTESDVTLEKAYKFALLAEKMVPKQSSLTAAATVQSYSRNVTSCFY